MKKVTEQYFCDLCRQEVSDANGLAQLRLAGHGIATSEREICWGCIHSFAEWKSARGER